MDAQIVYTEVRGIRFLGSEEMLRSALSSYSSDFEYSEASENIHQYHLFQPLPASLIVANRSVRANPLWLSNVILTFTSHSLETSKAVAEKFEELTDLELLTLHEDKRLASLSFKHKEKLFRELALEPAALE